MIVFATVSTKGGVGKTTLTANLGALLADLGLRVLLINADEQKSLNEYFQLSYRAPKGLTALFQARTVTPEMISRVQLPPTDVKEPRIRRMRPPRGQLDLIYSDVGVELERWFGDRIDYMWHLHEATHNPVVADLYDVILIDTQGAQGKVQDAAVVAADKIIHPVTPDALSAREFFTAFSSLIDRVSPVIRGAMPQIYAVIYRQSATSDARNFATEIRQEYVRLRGGVVVTETVIPHATAFPVSATQSTPVHWIDPKRAGECMHALAWELLPQLSGVRVSDMADVDQEG